MFFFIPLFLPFLLYFVAKIIFNTQPPYLPYFSACIYFLHKAVSVYHFLSSACYQKILLPAKTGNMQIKY